MAYRRHSRRHEPTVLDYARFHGIAKDYQSEGPLQPEKLPRALPFLTQELVDPPNAAKVQWPQNIQFQPERLEIDILGARALSFACRAPPLPSEPEDVIESKLRRVRDLKVELPLLRSDNELDMKRFRRRQETALSSFKFPLEDVNDEKDEGLAWPLGFRQRLEQIHKRIESEKLQVGRPGLMCLQECLKDDFSRNEQDILVDQVLREADKKVEKHSCSEPVTPPLLPLDPPLNPFPDPRSSSPTNQIEYTSSDSNSAAVEAQALEEQLMGQDTLVPPQQNYDPMLYDEPDAELLDIFSNLTYRPSSRSRKAADLKVEVPITPLSTEKKHKTVAFADDLTEFIATRPASASSLKEEKLLPSDFLHVDDKMEDDNDFDAFFRDEVGPIADKVTQRAEQEQLSEVDTVRRVDVPLMDFSLPVAPWEQSNFGNSDAQMQLLKECAKDDLSLELTCRTESLDAKLRWNPFTRQLPTTVADEVIRYEKDLAAFMAAIKLEETTAPESLAWKPDGLRVLDDLDEDEDALECATFSPGDDIDALVRKRKMEMRETQETAGNPSKKQQPSQTTPVELDINVQGLVKKTPASTQPASNSIFGGIFSTSTSLSSFMKVHSGIVTSPPSRAPEPSVQPHAELFRPPSRAPSSNLIPLPEILNPASFIISTHLSTQQRTLVAKIQSLYRSATLIERSPLAIMPSPLFASDNSPPKQPPQEEPLPVILLAPSTALLLPTFTALAQRPLPGGQPTPTNFFPLQLALVAQRCERVIVGVWRGARSAARSRSSEANATAPLTSAEALAFAEISGHAARLENSDVEVVLVPGAGEDGADEEEALARCVVRFVARFQRHPDGECEESHTSGAPCFKLLQDETLWEQVLRRAGMDAFAAQVVLDALKADEDAASDEETAREAGDTGLAAFVRMSQQDRVRRFGAVMGGRRVLDRVGQVLDKRWVCVGDGLKQ